MAKEKEFCRCNSGLKSTESELVKSEIILIGHDFKQVNTLKERQGSGGLEGPSHHEFYNHEKMNSTNNLNVTVSQKFPS